MVVNLCLPHFHTTVQCNKLCADGYDVTNLVSADPAVRRRGFKLEYFLRPPVQVTLKFGFQVELCRVDVELWPWGMDHGQAHKKLEISTSSDWVPLQKSAKRSQQNEHKQMRVRNVQNTETQREQGSKSRQSSGHQWSLQAQNWGEEALNVPQKKEHASMSRSHTESSNSEPEFKLVGRCELREETRVCFTRSNFGPRPPFPSLPPPLPTSCREEELWSRGLLSLGAVTHLRVTMPFGGAASALGLKSLVVWGQPARCCPDEEVERIKRAHEAGERPLPGPILFAPSVSQTKSAPEAAVPPSFVCVPIPEEFLDPITQEIMLLPMLLPSGVSVDRTTLDEHQKREATWGRAPNDPFTGVPFTSTSQPLPNPHLKSRIDHFLLQKGMMGRDGMLGRQREAEKPQASRLLASKDNGRSACQRESSPNSSAVSRNTNRTTQIQPSASVPSSDNVNHLSKPQPLSMDNKSVEGRNKRHLNRESVEGSTTENQLLPQKKKQRSDLFPSLSSHEQHLSASLDEALSSALRGRPSFTSNLSLQSRFTPESEPPNSFQNCPTAATPTPPTGEETCSACSCSLCVYSKTASPIYRLACGHLLCRPCLRKQSQPTDSVAAPTPKSISCPSCQGTTPHSDITRVHH